MTNPRVHPTPGFTAGAAGGFGPACVLRAKTGGGALPRVATVLPPHSHHSPALAAPARTRTEDKDTPLYTK